MVHGILPTILNDGLVKISSNQITIDPGRGFSRSVNRFRLIPVE
jgi:hypothetical protein